MSAWTLVGIAALLAVSIAFNGMRIVEERETQHACEQR
jgi:hypothetical protein